MTWAVILILLIISTSTVPYGRRGTTMIMVTLTALWLWVGAIYAVVAVIRWAFA